MIQNTNSPIDIETRDVHVRFTRIAILIFIVSVIVIAGALYAFYHDEIHSWQRLSGTAHSIEQQFPDPKVYWNNGGDVARPEAVYKWLDEEKTTAQIPVERALELAAERQMIRLSIDPSASKEGQNDQ